MLRTHQSKELDGYIDKCVEITLRSGAIYKGILGRRMRENKHDPIKLEVVDYYINTAKGTYHFQKSNVKRISEAISSHRLLS